MFAARQEDRNLARLSQLTAAPVKDTSGTDVEAVVTSVLGLVTMWRELSGDSYAGNVARPTSGRAARSPHGSAGVANRAPNHQATRPSPAPRPAALTRGPPPQPVRADLSRGDESVAATLKVGNEGRVADLGTMVTASAWRPGARQRTVASAAASGTAWGALRMRRAWVPAAGVQCCGGQRDCAGRWLPIARASPHRAGRPTPVRSCPYSR